MSDAVVISIVTATVAIVNSILIAWVKISINRVHKEINGRMGKLIETTKSLATANEKAKHHKK